MSEQSSKPPESNFDDAPEWLSAAEAHRRIVNVTLSRDANIAIARRANAGVLRSKALVLIAGSTEKPDAEIPKGFWWAGGEAALEQDWQTGDFETWVDRKLRLRALGVSFHLGDLQKCFPDVFKPDLARPVSSEPAVGKAGRPSAEWWDDLWIEICRALYQGDLQPKKQADIEKAMNDWIASSGNSASVSTVRGWARKLWAAISREGEN